MSHLKHFVTVLTLLLFCSISLPAGSLAGGILFLDSDPRGASVMINGVLQEKQTPILLRALPSGKTTITLDKLGYATKEIDIEVVDEKTEVISTSLEYAYSPVSFNNSMIRLHDGTELDDATVLLDNLNYSIDNRGTQIWIRPKFPYQPLIDGLNIAIPILTMLSIGLNANEVTFNKSIGNSVSPLAITAFSATTAMFIASVWLNISKHNYQKKNEIPLERYDSSHSNELFDMAELLYSEGELERAREVYDQLINQHPYSRLIPQAIYRAGRIGAIIGDDDNANSLFMRILDEFPLHTIYNGALQGLADNAVEADNYEAGMNYLNLLVPIGEGYTAEQIALMKCMLTDTWGVHNPDKAADAVAQWRALVENYPTSSNIENYRISLESAIDRTPDDINPE